ncbi:hypothetical protein BZA05DRAFT_229689 [Tricharina praecox]|uniref:uncharacterized protein n=1 Tax=Tricharina praecox TaxID=43433 RepID=UPI00221E6E4D|nr:uncharacterized protein BZA05DRAFT_229689 [Tricharina praecox]KAI5841231.1 hypothetical protein BZA05DRAFT_229689 [Tricharina praecox]
MPQQTAGHTGVQQGCTRKQSRAAQSFAADTTRRHEIPSPFIVVSCRGPVRDSTYSTDSLAFGGTGMRRWGGCARQLSWNPFSIFCTTPRRTFHISCLCFTPTTIHSISLKPLSFPGLAGPQLNHVAVACVGFVQSVHNPRNLPHGSPSHDDIDRYCTCLKAPPPHSFSQANKALV